MSSSYFEEIFDGSNARESLGNPQTFRDLPRLPIDPDPEYGFRDLFGEYGAADNDVKKIETDALIETLAPGLNIDQETGLPKRPAAPIPAPGSAAFGEFIKTWRDRPLPTAKASGGNWQSKKHERIVRNIISKARQKLPTTSPDADALWESLVNNMVDHCCACEHAACGVS